MKVVTLQDIPEIDLGEAVPIAGWDGGEVRPEPRRVRSGWDPVRAPGRRTAERCALGDDRDRHRNHLSNCFPFYDW